MMMRGKLRTSKPLFREFTFAIGEVAAAKDAQGKHFLGRQVWLEIGIEMFTHRLSQKVYILFLHFIIHYYFFLFERHISEVP